MSLPVDCYKIQCLAACMHLSTLGNAGTAPRAKGVHETKSPLITSKSPNRSCCSQRSQPERRQHGAPPGRHFISSTSLTAGQKDASQSKLGPNANQLAIGPTNGLSTHGSGQTGEPKCQRQASAKGQCLHRCTGTTSGTVQACHHHLDGFSILF